MVSFAVTQRMMQTHLVHLLCVTTLVPKVTVLLLCLKSLEPKVKMTKMYFQTEKSYLLAEQPANRVSMRLTEHQSGMQFPQMGLQ